MLAAYVTRDGKCEAVRMGQLDMLEMAANGAKILHLRCVEYARRQHVPVHVRSSFSDKPGTWSSMTKARSEASACRRAAGSRSSLTRLGLSRG